MNKLNSIKCGVAALTLALSAMLSSCSYLDYLETQDNSSQTATTKITGKIEAENTDDADETEAMTTTTAETTTTEETTTTTETTTAEAETEKPEETSASDTTEEENTENTYDHNEYFDIVETGGYIDSIGYTHLIHKVLAKKDVSISGTLIAYGNEGNVIEKSTDDIILTAGEYNFFNFSFEEDVSDASFNVTAKPQNDSFLAGERSAVELVQYDISGDYLYLTLKQNVDELSMFSQFKILFYKGDQIVDSDIGIFSLYAQNLTGKGSTDVAELWEFGTDYDRIEYFFEP